MNKNDYFSTKQLIALTWWHPSSQLSEYDIIICDGAIRSGKSFSMFISFVFWAFFTFNNGIFAICGKTISSISRNLVIPMLAYLNKLGFICNYTSSKNKIIINYKNKVNTFYIFSGRDESSASLIQGITLSGILLDEVVLMPQSFVEQAIARCSIENSKIWFNCNPQHPAHWFYQNWIIKAKQRNVLYLHFKMSDNPSLSKRIIYRYKSIYSDSFYKRFVEGLWCLPDGLVYPMFNRNNHIIETLPLNFEKYYVSCDYGTVNPTSMGLWGLSNKIWYRIKEFYHSSKKSGKLKTDEEYYIDLLNLTNGLSIESVIIDPSASNFIQCISSHKKFKIILAKNDVLTGISKVSGALSYNKIFFHSSCVNTFREFSLYQWDQNTMKDYPKKENDHTMDDIRYFVNTVISNENKYGFYVHTTYRNNNI